MANLVVTSVCNLHCSYCFAREYLESAPNTFISLPAFEARLDFLDRSGINEVRLMGGEPTLHPQFPQLIERAQRGGRVVVVFSHGLIPERALQCLESLPLEQCTVLINLNATGASAHATEAEQARRRQTLTRLGKRALPGYTLHTARIALDWVLPLIVETGCRRMLRLGLAQPTLTGANVSVPPKLYPALGDQIAAFTRRAAEVDVRLQFDCGFVRCMFSEASLAALQAAQADVGWRCNPVLDITDDAAAHCFPLATQFRVPFAPSALATDLRQTLTEHTAPYRSAGIYRECSVCGFKQRGECSGGCLATTVRRFQPATLSLHVPASALES